MTGLVLAHLKQKLDLVVFRQEFAEAIGRPGVLGLHDLAHQPGARRERVDGGEVAGPRQLARQGDMPIGQAHHLFGDGIVRPLVLDQNGEQGRDRAARGAPGPLHHARQLGVDRWRVATAHGGLAGGQGHLAHRARVARHGIEQKQHVLPLIAKVLGNGGGDLAGHQALHGGALGGGGHHHAAFAQAGRKLPV